MAEITLSAAREYLQANIVNGVTCPCCGQQAKVYRRRITKTSARTLITLWAQFGSDYGHIPSLVATHFPDKAHQGGYHTIPQYWGLIEAQPSDLHDGKRDGYWRVTDVGERFLRGEIGIPMYALTYNGETVGFDGQEQHIYDCLGAVFDLDEVCG